jgi:hypothetical protein
VRACALAHAHVRAYRPAEELSDEEKQPVRPRIVAFAHGLQPHRAVQVHRGLHAAHF